MCLQLREDGKLCEVVRRHRRDVNRLVGLAELAYRPPRPPHDSSALHVCANPRRVADMLSIEVSPMPPRFTGSRACRRARSRCASEPDSEPTILWKAVAMILSRSRAASMVRDGGMVRRKYAGLYRAKSK